MSSVSLQVSPAGTGVKGSGQWGTVLGPAISAGKDRALDRAAQANAQQSNSVPRSDVAVLPFESPGAMMMVAGDLEVTVHEVVGLKGDAKSTHPFVRLLVDKQRQQTKSIKWSTITPVWNEEVLFYEVRASVLSRKEASLFYLLGIALTLECVCFLYLSPQSAFRWFFSSG